MTPDARHDERYPIPNPQSPIPNTPLPALFCALASLLLYVRTAAPSVATLFDDSLEFQVVLPTLGIAHPSGYPLYTLLGKLFTLVLPFRDPAGRINLFSALCAAAAVGLFYLVAHRLAGSRPAALIATAAFALSPAWWSQATIAEVYALHGLLLILFIYFLLRWEESRDREPANRTQTENKRQEAEDSHQLPVTSYQPSIPNTQYLIPATFTFGLGLAHHRTIALLLPAALIFIFWADPGLLRRPRRWLWPVGLGLAPLLLYLYLPLRAGQGVTSLDAAFVPTLAGTLEWITARGYSVFLTGNPFGVSRDAAFFVDLFPQQIGAPLVLAAFWGLTTGWRYAPRRYVFLLLATAGQIAFGALYKVADVEVFFIPAFMLSALWAALGLTPIFDHLFVWLAGLGRLLRLPVGWRPAVFGAGALAVAAVCLFQPLQAAVRDFPQRDRSRSWEVYDYGQDILASVAPGGQVVGLLGETTLVRYFRDVLGQRADISVVPADAEAARFAAIEAALAQGRPVYLTRDLPGAATRYSLDAAGPLIAVGRKERPGPAPTGTAVAAGIVLVDAQTEVRRTHAGPVVRLALTWAASAAVREELKVSARLLDSAGQVIAQDDRVPVHFAYPTTAWVPGELVRDVYDLRLPPNTASGPRAAMKIAPDVPAQSSQRGTFEVPGTWRLSSAAAPQPTWASALRMRPFVVATFLAWPPGQAVAPAWPEWLKPLLRSFSSAVAPAAAWASALKIGRGRAQTSADSLSPRSSAFIRVPFSSAAAPQPTWASVLLILYRAADGSEVGRVQLPGLMVR